MDKTLEEKIKQKINETFQNKEEIFKITEQLKELSDNTSGFTLGIALGRLYNSFYYQSRRILKRDPTPEEFSEFLDIIKNHESDFKKKLS